MPPADVERGVAEIAGRLHRFSPDVEPSRDEPGVFWLNASGLSYLQASLGRWAEEIVASLRACGFRAAVAVGFTRFGTYAVARTAIPREAVGHDGRAGTAGTAGATGTAGTAGTAGATGTAGTTGTTGAAGVITRGVAVEAVTTAGADTSGVPVPVPVPVTVTVLRDPAGERALTGRARLSRLGIDPALRDSLHKLGIRTVGAFLRLPSEGIRRRFGPEAQRLHRLAAGDSWVPLQPLRIPEPLVARHDLDDPETDATRLLFRVKRLLDRQLATVTARHQALAELTLYLRLDRAGGAHTERIRPAAPTLDIVLLMNLVRLRLESVALGAGVVELRIVGRAVAATAVQQGLFVERPSRDRAVAERALARVRAEFGDEAVVRARLAEAHLPEARFAWEPVETVPPPGPREVACPPMVRRIHARPTALPQPRIGGKWGSEPGPGPDSRSVREEGAGYVRDLAGPYLISGGWWCTEVYREYYFARMRDGGMLWIYYDRPRRRWRWQGQVE